MDINRKNPFKSDAGGEAAIIKGGKRNRRELIVAADGSGQFSSIQEAVDSIPACIERVRADIVHVPGEAPDETPPETPPETVIRIKSGIYREKVFIDKPFVTLLGEDPENTVIEYGDYAMMKFPDGRYYNTFWTYTLFAGGTDFHAENLTIANTAGKGEVVGQAIAAYVDGDRAQFYNCRFLGNQDTLFTGPLPPYPLTVKTFGGPRDGKPRVRSRQYYKDCYIRGDIDFIFGSATAVFEDCELFSNRLKPGRESYITAPSTPEGQRYGYVFQYCRLNGDAEQGSVYLGRPWRNFGKAAFLHCELGSHIHPEGWHNWNKPESELTTEFAEYGAVGAGRVTWSKQLKAQEAEQYNTDTVLSGEDGWKPGGGGFGL